MRPNTRSVVAALALAAATATIQATPALADDPIVDYASDGTPIYASESDVPIPEGNDVAPGPDPRQPEGVTDQECTKIDTITVNNTPNKYDVHWGKIVSNQLDKEWPYEVTQTVSGSTNWNVSISVTGGVDTKLFGKIETSVNGGVARTTTTQIGEKLTIPIKAYKNVRVDHGVWEEHVSFYWDHRNRFCKWTRKAGKASAPFEIAKWRVFYV